MLNHKVGDKIKIVENLKDVPYTADTMLQYAGKEADIMEIEPVAPLGLHYKLDIDGRIWNWSNKMFESVGSQETKDDNPKSNKDLNVGDTAVIREDLEEIFKDKDLVEKYYLISDMLEYAGKEAKIVRRSGEEFWVLSIDKEFYFWHKDLLRIKEDNLDNNNSGTTESINDMKNGCKSSITIEELKARGFKNGDFIYIEWNDEAVWYIFLGDSLYRFNSDKFSCCGDFIKHDTFNTSARISKIILSDSLEFVDSNYDFSKFLTNNSDESLISNLITEVTHPHVKQAVEIYETIFGTNKVIDLIKDKDSPSTPDFQDVVYVTDTEKCTQQGFGIVQSVRVEMLNEEETLKYPTCKKWEFFK